MYVYMMKIVSAWPIPHSPRFEWITGWPQLLLLASTKQRHALWLCVFSCPQGGQWARVIWSALLHVDDWHLYYNMTSFLVKVCRLFCAYADRNWLLLSVWYTLAHQHAAWLSCSFLQRAQYYMDGIHKTAISLNSWVFACWAACVNSCTAQPPANKLTLYEHSTQTFTAGVSVVIIQKTRTDLPRYCHVREACKFVGLCRGQR